MLTISSENLIEEKNEVTHTIKEITSLEFHLNIESGNKKQQQWVLLHKTWVGIFTIVGQVVSTLRLLDVGQW